MFVFLDSTCYSNRVFKDGLSENKKYPAAAGYISQKLSKEFYQEHRRILLAKPRVNMKKIMTEFQEYLYGTRMLIELNFRSLKMFYGLLTSLPRSVDGYFANYIYSLLAYQII